MQIKVKISKTIDRPLQRGFTATVDGIKVEGTALNTRKHHMLSSDHLLSSSDHLWRLRLVFTNPDVKKHPEYKEIRRQIIKGLLIECGPSVFTAGVTL